MATISCDRSNPWVYAHWLSYWVREVFLPPIKTPTMNSSHRTERTAESFVALRPESSLGGKQTLNRRRTGPTAKIGRRPGNGQRFMALALLVLLSWGAPAGAQEADEAVNYLSFAQFKIPFNVHSPGEQPARVQLWVSTDGGDTWQLHGTVGAESTHFDFRAAAEGLYLFAVQTVNEVGAAFASPLPPLRVFVDTTVPQATVQADVNGEGQLVVEVVAADDHLDSSTAELRIRTNQEATWERLSLQESTAHDGRWEARAVTDLRPCREVAAVFTIKDLAGNATEASCRLSMPRTAAADKDLTLASARNTKSGNSTSPEFKQPSTGIEPFPNAIAWNPGEKAPDRSAALGVSQKPLTAAARLASDGQLNLVSPLDAESVEELPLPPPVQRLEQALDQRPADDNSSRESQSKDGVPRYYSSTEPAESANAEPSFDQPASAEPSFAESASPSSESTPGPAGISDPLGLQFSEPADREAYHCRTRAFSLDYAVDTLGGSSLADVELWGTENNGNTWQKWGSDPDRVSPFDVRVGNDGLFGFRMVIVGSNGVVSNRPRSGDDADAWIRVDSSAPRVKIARAVYGQDSQEGMLVIDYTAHDEHLAARPVTLSYSDRRDGPWTRIDTGLANSGSYAWKPSPQVPHRIFLKIEVVDKAGNVGSYQLDLPIDTQGLAPRGRIQGFHPIETD